MKSRTVQGRNNSGLNVPVKTYSTDKDLPTRQLGINSSTGRNDYEREGGSSIPAEEGGGVG